jgi:hypothetical protein
MSKESAMRILILAALLGGCGGSSPDLANGEVGNDGNDTNPDDKTGKATLSYTVSVMGKVEPCKINIECEDIDLLTVSSGEIVEVDVPASCVISAGLLDYTDIFGYPVHLGEDGEYWAATPLTLDLEPQDEILDQFITFNVFEPGYYDCEYDKYELDESAGDLKGEQWMEDHPVDEQFIEVGQDGIVEIEGNNETLDVVGGPQSHLQTVDDGLVLVVAGEEIPYYIAESDIGVDNFSLTVVNTELGHVSDVRCELD